MEDLVTTTQGSDIHALKNAIENARTSGVGGQKLSKAEERLKNLVADALAIATREADIEQLENAIALGALIPIATYTASVCIGRTLHVQH